MKKVVVDSDIVINHIKDNNNDLELLVSLQGRNKIQLFLPTIVVVEVFVGYELKGKKLSKIKKLISSFNQEGLTTELAYCAAKIGRVNKLAFMGSADLIIAATAKKLKAEVATNNIKHFKLIPGLKIFDFKKNVNS